MLLYSHTTAEMICVSRFLRVNQGGLALHLRRCRSSQTEGEARIARILKEKFPLASSLKVVDISGGCGAMYEVHIESNEFKGKRIIQQHQQVNQALKDEIEGMHGLRIFTDVPQH